MGVCHKNISTFLVNDVILSAYKEQCCNIRSVETFGCECKSIGPEFALILNTTIE